MINRQLIRLKVLQLIYAYYRNGGKAIEIAEKELIHSLDKAYELYKYLLTLLVEIRDLAARRAENAQERSLRLSLTEDEALAEARLAANALLAQLDENETLLNYREKEKVDWLDEEPIVRLLLDAFCQSDAMQLYLETGDFSYAADRELVRKLYKTIVCGNDIFTPFLEEHSIYWNDDKTTIDSFVVKTIKRFTPETTPDQPLLPPFAADADRQYAIELFHVAIERGAELRELIRTNCQNWDFSRMAFMDVIIAQIALAEIISFPTIPLNVTFDEYLNIARAYSTPRSASYLNGLLEHIVDLLREQGVTTKVRWHKKKK
jgi:transcription antitermination protein NusB